MKLLTKNNVIIAISKVAEIVPNGIKLDNYILGIAVNNEGNFTEELPVIIEHEGEIPKEVREHSHCYDKEKGFYPNPNYVPVIDEKKEKEAFTQTLAELTIGDKKKDAMIAELVSTVANLTIEINKLKGSVAHV